MGLFLVKRLLFGAVLVVALSTAAFLLLFGSTATVARNLLGEGATAEQVAATQAGLGLDQPLVVQYARWIGAAATGDLGTSWFTSRPVAALLADRLPVTLSMLAVTITATAVLSVALGMAAAVRGGRLDRLVQVLSVVGFALPGFWVAMLLVQMFALTLGWLPATGYVRLSEDPAGWAASLVLPVTALTIGSVSATAQQVRGAAVDVLQQDYVRTLRAHGLQEGSVLCRHVLRNAAGPALTVLSLQAVGLLGGATTIEQVFAIPGIGQLTVDAGLRGDIPVLMGVVTTSVLLVVGVNTAADATAGWLTPKACAR